MTRITIDADMRNKLMNFTKPLELCDESGFVLGKLTPSTPETDPDNWIDLTPDISDEDIQREIDSGEETYSTQELIDQIKKRRAI